MRIGFVGLGKLGLPVALAVDCKEHQVYGYDINEEQVKHILDTAELPYLEEKANELLEYHGIDFKPLAEVVSISEIIFVPIQTPHNPEYEGVTRIPDSRQDFDYTYLIDGIKAISKVADEQNLKRIIVIISTVLPGTIESKIKPILSPNLQLCYNPFFIAMGTTIDDFLNPEFVLLGVDDEEAKDKVKAFYKTIHNRPIYETSIKNAELIKVSYNTYIGMKIVFANTIMEICHKIGADCDAVTGAIKMANKRLISPMYLTGGMGDGGGCHPRDNIAMSWLANELNLSHNFFDDIMQARESQTEFLADLMLEHPGPYYVLGKTFKENTNLVTGSPAMLLANILKERGVEFKHYDPYLIDSPYDAFGPGTYIVVTKHEAFKRFSFPYPSVIIDVWGYLKRHIEEHNLIKYIPVGR